MIKIDDDVPLPDIQYGGRKPQKWPLAELEIGQSFFVPNVKITTAASYLQYHKRPDRRFAARQMTESDVKGVRVFCVALIE